MTKSTAQLAFEGNTKKHLQKQNPLVEGAPDMPPGLGPDAAKLWRKLVPELHKLGIVSSIDESMLAGLCYWWQIYLTSQAALAGVTDYSTTSGKRALEAVAKAWTEYSRIARQFGLTATSRKGIDVGNTVDIQGDRWIP